jgi:DNA-binding response OmpR family regulator
MEFDPTKMQLHIDQTIHTLAQKESEILHYLLQRRGQTVSSGELVQNLWTYETMPTSATLRSYIRDLRKLVGNETIQTVRGVGYYFVK